MCNAFFDCLPVSISTEPLYSDDQFANSYSNPYKLYTSMIQCSNEYFTRDTTGANYANFLLRLLTASRTCS